MATKEQEINTERFAKRLKESQPAVDFAKEYLERNGYEVVKPEDKGVTPSYEDRMKYVDNGDLYCKKGDTDEWCRVEVKHQSREFTCKEDWPFKNMFVLAKHALDRANPKPSFYLNFNKSLTHVAKISSESESEWFLMPFQDKRYLNKRETAYACPINFVEFSTVGV